MMPTIPKIRISSQVNDLSAAPVAVLFSDKIVPFLLYLGLNYLATFLVVVFFAVAAGFLGAMAALAGVFLVAFGLLDKLGATTVLTAALTNSIRLPGVVSTMTLSSRIETIFPFIPPSITTSDPTATDSDSCLAALERFLLLKMMKAKKAARIMSREKSIRNQSIGRF